MDDTNKQEEGNVQALTTSIAGLTAHPTSPEMPFQPEASVSSNQGQAGGQTHDTDMSDEQAHMLADSAQARELLDTPMDDAPATAGSVQAEGEPVGAANTNDVGIHHQAVGEPVRTANTVKAGTHDQTGGEPVRPSDEGVVGTHRQAQPHSSAVSTEATQSATNVIVRGNGAPQLNWADEMNAEAAKKTVASPHVNSAAAMGKMKSGVVVPAGKVNWQNWKDAGAPPCECCRKAGVNAKHPPPCDDALHHSKLRNHASRIKAHDRTQALTARVAAQSKAIKKPVNQPRKVKQVSVKDQARNLLTYGRFATSEVARELYGEVLDQVMREAEEEQGGMEARGKGRVPDSRPLPLRRR